MDTDLVTPFIEYLGYEKRFSKHTLVAYEGDLTRFTAFLQQQYETGPEKATHLLIRSWIAGMMEEKMSPRSVNRKITTLKTFYKYLLREGHVKTNPMLKIQGPKTPKRLPVFVEQSPMDAVLDGRAINEQEDGVLIQLILELFYGTGIRRSELIHLRQSNVDFRKSTIKVLGKRNKERIIPVNTPLLKLIEAYVNQKKQNGTPRPDDDSDYLLQHPKSGKKLTEKFVYNKVIKYLAEVTTIDKKSPHVLRHTFATHMLNNGADLNAIKELLGHANLSATQVYTHNTVEKLKNIHHKSHPRA